MSLSNNVRTGIWTDYGRHDRVQFLESNYWATWPKFAVTASLLLSSIYLWEIWKSLLLQIHCFLNRKHSWFNQTNTVDDPDSESQPLVARQIRRARGGRDLLKESFNSFFESGQRIYGSHAIITIVVLFTLFGAFVVEVLAGMFSERIATDKAAILASSHCGLYEFDDTRAGDEEAARADVYLYGREKRAGEYAQSCYGPSDTPQLMRCDSFYNSSIGFDRPEHDRICPFKDPNICASGYSPGSGVTFDTGLVDSSILGVNFKPTHKFRRRTTCSPLNMDHPHIKRWHNRRTNTTGYHYYYGGIYDQYNHSRLITPYTLDTSGDSFNWLAPGYWVNTFGTTLLGGDVYRPIPALETPDDSTLTIIFVLSTHILYNKPSNDPIFPAAEEFTKPDEREPYWINHIPIARPLACVDTTLLCSPDGKRCWSMHAPIDDANNTTAYWFMKYALGNSNTYDSIKLRLGTALLAQQRIGQARSLPLRDGHWEDEAAHLFATSLARAQFDAWSIACGEDHERPGYKDSTPDQVKGRLCGLYKFNKDGYINIELGAFVGLLLVLPVTYLLSRETKKAEEIIPKNCLAAWGWKAGGGEGRGTRPVGDNHTSNGSDSTEVGGDVSGTSAITPNDAARGDDVRTEGANASIDDNLGPGTVDASLDSNQLEETWEPLLINTLLGYIFVPIRYMLYAILVIIRWMCAILCVG
ncbi:hypothetical protein AOQ84DRAFT_406004 [Glonium stellatum]|uniref:Uncharacterized protein n=1 Tax=Glonium stellatum TaxID=574774 RepID=A0A8E2F1C7_9PEZI|nr:hypothetical protein AOQ84DRAFT_406004 [Glonium stellatum]